MISWMRTASDVVHQRSSVTGTRSLAKPGIGAVAEEGRGARPARRRDRLAAARAPRSAGFTSARTEVVTTLRPAARGSGHMVSTAGLRVLEPVAHVAEAVGVDREQRVEVAGRGHADGSTPAQLARHRVRSCPGLYAWRPDELQVGMGHDPAQRELPGVAGAEMDDPVGHSEAGCASRGRAAGRNLDRRAVLALG